MTMTMRTLMTRQVFLLATCWTAVVPIMSADGTELSQHAETLAKHLPAGGIVVGETVAGGEPIFSAAGKLGVVGVAPERLIFEIGSLSKVFTGLLLAQAVIEKKVTLDTTLATMLGDLVKLADANVGAITLEQLATHTSGLPRLPTNLAAEAHLDDPYRDYDRRALDDYLRSARLDHAPPFSYAYSNLGAGLLGDILSRLYGKEWEQLVTERIAGPLGMIDTVVHLTSEQKRRLLAPHRGQEEVSRWHFKALAGAGALHSTAADLMLLLAAMDHPEKSPMREALELLMSARGSGRTGLFIQRLELKSETGFWHTGGTGGFNSWMSTKPKSRRRVVILINNEALKTEDVVSGKVPDSLLPADPALARYVGVFDTGVVAAGKTIHYTFEARGKSLRMQITGQPWIELSKISEKPGCFATESVKAEIHFTGGDDSAESVTLFQAGLEIHAKRIKEGAR